MEELTGKQKGVLPAYLLLDPQAQRAAAYNFRQHLITETASAELLAYAKLHQEAVERYRPEEERRRNGELISPTRFPLPAWATPEVQERMLLVRVRTPGLEADDAWRAVPKK